MKASGVVVYSFDGLYEITRTPGQAESHTLYFKGLYGDVFSQMTRSDATLVASSFSGSKSSNSLDVVKSTGIFSFAKGDAFPPNSFVKGFFCEDIAGSCSDYYVNTAKYYYVRSAFRVVGIINTVEYDVFVWMMLVVVLYLVYIQSRRHRRDVARYVSTMIYAKRTLSVTPLLIVSILFTFTQCGLVSGGGKKGEAPWILLASGISNDTASVDDVATGNTVTPSSPNAPIGSIPPSISGNNTNGSGGYRPSGAGGYNGGSGGAALVPVTGMYFLHPDHLGSITMITDGRGNVIAGGNNGGKSHISYTPYGGIHRTDSSGPDITRFKYTGQEEDKESGLLYYKARYYDPMVGRFLQADSVVMPQSTFGMNRYMYVGGNPVRFGDDSGHKASNAILGAIAGYAMAGQFGLSPNEGAALGAGIGMGNKGGNNNIGRNIDHGSKAIAKNSQGWVNYQMAANFGYVKVKGDAGENIIKTVQWALRGIDGIIHPKKKKNDFEKSDLGSFLQYPAKHIIGSDFDHIYGAGVIGRNPGCAIFVANVAGLVAAALSLNIVAEETISGTILYDLGFTKEAVTNAMRFYNYFDVTKGVGSTGTSSKHCDAKSL
jgi:RHS repeat-associated protein